MKKKHNCWARLVLSGFSVGTYLLIAGLIVFVLAGDYAALRPESWAYMDDYHNGSGKQTSLCLWIVLSMVTTALATGAGLSELYDWAKKNS